MTPNNEEQDKILRYMSGYRGSQHESWLEDFDDWKYAFKLACDRIVKLKKKVEKLEKKNGR